ncbi:MAG: hypothetical protein ABI607_14670 [Betaproteobacteria bacterium]
MATTTNKLDKVMDDARELEDFLHALLPALDAKKLTQGDDVLHYAKRLKLKIPGALRGAAVTWETDHSDLPAKSRGETLTFVRPGHADAVGLVIKCVKVKKWRFCLECGWLWCRIVVTRKF